MKLELRKLKVNKAQTEETTCFSAELWADGKKVGTASNRGSGGCNEYFWTDRELGKKLEAWVALQPTKYEFEKLDQLLDHAMDVAEVAAQFKRWCSKKTMFRLKGDKKDEWRHVVAKFEPKVKEFLVKKYGDQLECIINEDIAAAAEKYA